MSDPADAEVFAPGVFAPGLLAGKVALVTGGGSGIGYGIARGLAAGGASLTLFSRDAARLDTAADRLAGAPAGRPLTVAGDVRDPESIRAAVSRTMDGHGRLDILINNAAGNFYAPSAELSPNGWRAVIEIDLFGTFYACQAVYPLMAGQRFGRIVSISMTLHHRGWPLMAHATAAKAGVDALTRTLALEWARDGINLNAVAPGPIPTEGVRKAFTPPTGVGEGGAGGDADMFGERAMEGFARRFIPVGRLGTPSDIADMVTFLVSPAGDWITGGVFVVDGGESLASPRTIPDRR